MLVQNMCQHGNLHSIPFNLTSTTYFLGVTYIYKKKYALLSRGLVVIQVVLALEKLK